LNVLNAIIEQSIVYSREKIRV